MTAPRQPFCPDAKTRTIAKSFRTSETTVTRPKFIFAVLTSLLLGACATVTGDGTQAIRIELANEDGVSIPWASCLLSNEHGDFSASPPVSVRVRRGAENLRIVCSRDGFPDAHGSAVSHVNLAMWGNVVSAGAGAYIDHKRGAGYEYPDKLRLVVGQTLRFDGKKVSREMTAALPASKSP